MFIILGLQHNKIAKWLIHHLTLKHSSTRRECKFPVGNLNKNVKRQVFLKNLRDHLICAID